MAHPPHGLSQDQKGSRYGGSSGIGAASAADDFVREIRNQAARPLRSRPTYRAMTTSTITGNDAGQREIAVLRHEHVVGDNAAAARSSQPHDIPVVADHDVACRHQQLGGIDDRAALVGDLGAQQQPVRMLTARRERPVLDWRERLVCSRCGSRQGAPRQKKPRSSGRGF
jgi:hypothetical protein